jgi:hypothetical protein
MSHPAFHLSAMVAATEGADHTPTLVPSPSQVQAASPGLSGITTSKPSEDQPRATLAWCLSPLPHLQD